MKTSAGRKNKKRGCQDRFFDLAKGHLADNRFGMEPLDDLVGELLAERDPALTEAEAKRLIGEALVHEARELAWLLGWEEAA